MEKSITKVMEDPFLKCLKSKEEKNRTTANELKFLRANLDSAELYLKYSLSQCKKLNSDHIESLEHLVRMIKHEIEETKEQLDKKLKYWNRFATI